MTSGRNVLSDRDCPDQSAHNDYVVWKGRSHWFFVLYSRFEAIFLLVRPALHTFLHYPMAEKKQLAELLLLQEVNIPAYSVFVALNT